jgi:branched-chain amino acid transport system substrate-binding protein
MGNRSVVVIMGVLALLVCAGPGMVWAQKGPMKIGVITPMTGAAAAIGKDMVNGLNLYLEQNGQQIAGRKVEVIVEDSQGKPDVALTKLRKLVESDKVQVLLGEVFAHIGYAMAPRVDEYKVPMLYPVIAADDLTQRKPAKWVVRTGWTSSQPSHPFGEWVYNGCSPHSPNHIPSLSNRNF